MKDPRITLKFIFRLSIFLLICVPLLYFTLKFNPMKFLSYAVIIMIVIFLIKKFYKKDKEKALSNITKVSYMFAFTYIFIFLILLIGGLNDYLKNSEAPPPLAILILLLLLTFGIVLFLYSNKSRRYEKKLSLKNK